MQVENPGHLVQAIFSSFNEAKALSDWKVQPSENPTERNLRFWAFWRKLEILFDKFLTSKGGQYHIFELCLLLRTHGLLQGKMSVLDDTLIALLHGRGITAHSSGYRVPDLDFAATCRRLRHSMDEHGCTLQTPVVPEVNDEMCPCYRAKSFQLLYEVQMQAWSQIRGKIMLTTRAVCPQNVCDLVFFYALVAEGVPLDPRVPVPGERMDSTWKPGRFQTRVQAAYRCPRLVVLHEEEQKRMELVERWLG